MAGAYRWKGAVQFGPLLQFNVIAQSAVRPADIGFNMHHGDEKCLGRVRSDLVCEECGMKLVRQEVVKGFQGVAPVDMEYIESLQAEKDGLCVLEGLVPASEIDPRYFQKSYDVVPDKGGEKPYVLLLRILETQKRVAIGRLVMGTKQYIVAFRPQGGGISMEALYWPEEVQTESAAVDLIAGIKVSQAELGLGRKLAEHMTMDFDADSYHNEYAEAVRAYLEDLLAGKKPTKSTAAKPRKVSVKSLEEALAQSLAAMGDQQPPKRKKAVA